MRISTTKRASCHRFRLSIHFLQLRQSNLRLGEILMTTNSTYRLRQPLPLSMPDGSCTEGALRLALRHPVSAETEEQAECDHQPKTVPLVGIQAEAEKNI